MAEDQKAVVTGAEPSPGAAREPQVRWKTSGSSSMPMSHRTPSHLPETRQGLVASEVLVNVILPNRERRADHVGLGITGEIRAPFRVPRDGIPGEAAARVPGLPHAQHPDQLETVTRPCVEGRLGKVV